MSNDSVNSSERQPPRRYIVCDYRPKDPIDRVSKWGVSINQRAYPYWPPYCKGLSFIATTDLIPLLFDASFYVPFLWLDDVYVTGFLPLFLGGEDFIQYVKIKMYYVSDKNMLRMTKGKKSYALRRRPIAMFAKITKDEENFLNIWSRLLTYEERRRRLRGN